MLFLSNIRLKEKWRQAVSVYLQEQLLFLEKVSKLREFSFPQLIVVPLSCHEVDGVRKEKERLTAALAKESLSDRLSLHKIKLEIAIRKVYEKEKGK